MKLTRQKASHVTGSINSVKEQQNYIGNTLFFLIIVDESVSDHILKP